MILDSEQLVTNGDFSDGTTGWSGSSSLITNVSNNLIITGDGTAVTVRAFSDTSEIVTNEKIYTKVRVRVNNALATSFRILWRADRDWETHAL